jgi:hypothetical protein
VYTVLVDENSHYQDEAATGALHGLAASGIPGLKPTARDCDLLGALHSPS